MNPERKEQRGFLTFAQNNSTTDYLRLAYAQALNIKATQREVKSYAVIVDTATMALVTDKHRAVFDYIIELASDHSASVEWKLNNEWQAWWLSPFKETIKLESDILFPASIDHWWNGFQSHEIILTNHVRTFEGKVSTARTYRRLFDENLLPDVYNGLMYFRHGRVSMEFFVLASEIYLHWDLFKNSVLVSCRDDNPTTDVVFAIAARILGEEKCTNPALSYPTFAHMKSGIQGWGTDLDWTDVLYSQIDKTNITIGFTRQMNPIHYYNKEFITDEIIAHYEKEASNIT